MADDLPPPHPAAPPDEATRRQIAAADPARSTWLSANAGSGKTRVLTDRAARLLLEGARPETILCLTYTKAAAGEMQNRLFDRLGAWAMAPDADLRTDLAALGVAEPLDPDRLAKARRLFARAIETPGGLKIQTIHAFCAAVLRQFPLEADVSPSFTEMDDRSLALLRDGVLEQIARGPRADCLRDLARYLSSDQDLDGLTATLLRERSAFRQPRDLAQALAMRGLPNSFDETALMAEVIRGDEDRLLSQLHQALARGTANDIRAARALQPLLGKPPDPDWLRRLEAIVLTGSAANAPFTAKIGTLPTKKTRQGMAPELVAAIEALMSRVEIARPRRIALLACRRDAALHAFAGAFLPAMDAAKAARGMLDFDDLILRTRRLLATPGVSDWILYKLDGRIAHLLVDEAQDTSPEQWQIIEHLARDLLAGDGRTRAGERTLFIVGDRKQSIYSFQGADPDAFDGMRDTFDTRLSDLGQSLDGDPLLHSFRSSQAVLDVVDATFADGAPGIGAAPDHRAFCNALPGRVDLWPLVPPPDPGKADRDWTTPVDETAPEAAPTRLARCIAARLRQMIDDRVAIPDGMGWRAMDEGDVLILVRSRGPLFRALIAACKAERLALAGTDRVNLLSELAVRDLLAYLDVLALPEDDLALATLLRSPLFGWSEDALYRLAQPRDGYLWQALRNDPTHEETRERIQTLRDLADFRRPYEVLERILTRDGGRQALLARLGPDCEEAIDLLLAQALAYESTEIPSLTGFLIWIRSADIDMRRQLDRTGRQIRIMTVHGAKGLEAPVVILPDTADQRAPSPGAVLLTEDGLPVWTPPSDALPDDVAQAKDAATARQTEERQRLLYVAMTRAMVWLIVCGAGSAKETGESWFTSVSTGMARLDALPAEQPTGTGLRLQQGAWPASMPSAGPLAEPAPAKPAWWDRAAAIPDRPVQAVSPSQLGGAKALPGERGQDEATALRRGSALHLLLERLPDYPQASWLTVGQDLMLGRLPADEAARTVAEATAVLTRPDLARLFGPDTLAEVALSAALPGGARLRGAVDRLIIAPDHVLAVDFKSNARIPETAAAVPDGIRRQMGAYAAALATIYPDRRVKTAILWTATATLMPLPEDLTAAALRDAASEGHLDG